MEVTVKKIRKDTGWICHWKGKKMEIPLDHNKSNLKKENPTPKCREVLLWQGYRETTTQ